jgi:protein-S-isoprenylcysteine O-methyltransferase Ste14
MARAGPDEEKDMAKRRQMLRAAVGFVLYLLLSPALLFLSAGTLAWPMAWVYVVLALVAALGSRLIVLRRSPDLLRERAQYAEAEGAKPGDRLLVVVVGILGPAVMAIVAGLDYRAAWGPSVPPTVQILAAVLVAIGFGLGSWAMIVNQFFSAVVRIQKERGHGVVRTGPYRIVRHPAYAGGILAEVAIPFMLDAIWVMVPALVIIAAIVARTALEDRRLLEELPGYPEYAGRTRYRLLPGVW